MKTGFVIILMGVVAVFSFHKTEPKIKSEQAIIKSDFLIKQADLLIKKDSIKWINQQAKE